MKIARFSTEGDPRFGIVDEEEQELVVLSGDPMFSGYDTTGERVPLSGAKLLAPVIPRSKIVGVGVNYDGADDELGGRTEHPVLFLKPNTSVVGPGDPIRVPGSVGRVVHEGELAIVIGSIAKNVTPDRADSVVFGYTVANDVSARDQLVADGQWARAEGYDTFCPIGPVIETEFDVSAGRIRTLVDREQRRTGSTADMIFSVADLVAFVSSVYTLLPGDIILTGSPGGAGEIRPGQAVEVAIEGIGSLVNPVVGV